MPIFNNQFFILALVISLAISKISMSTASRVVLHTPKLAAHSIQDQHVPNPASSSWTTLPMLPPLPNIRCAFLKTNCPPPPPPPPPLIDTAPTPVSSVQDKALTNPVSSSLIPLLPALGCVLLSTSFCPPPPQIIVISHPPPMPMVPLPLPSPTNP